MTHISKMAEDFVIYSSAEFGFITLSDAYRLALVNFFLKFLLIVYYQHRIEHDAAKEEP